MDVVDVPSLNRVSPTVLKRMDWGDDVNPVASITVTSCAGTLVVDTYTIFT
jgi:hypothetical protein